MIDFDDDDIVIVSIRCEHPGPVVPGAIKYPCAECGFMVWLAPYSQHNLVIAKAVICIECLNKNHDGLEEHQLVDLSQDQNKEIMNKFGFVPSIRKEKILDWLKTRFKEE